MSDFTPVPNVNPEDPAVMTALGTKSPNCLKCDAPPSEHEVRNHSLIWHDGDVYCRRCGTYVRRYDAG